VAGESMTETTRPKTPKLRKKVVGQKITEGESKVKVYVRIAASTFGTRTEF